MKKYHTQEEIAKRIIEYCLGRNKFIYISGNGGAGKTTLSKHLVQELNSKNIQVNCIDMDEFVLDTKMRKSAKKVWTDINKNLRESEYTTSFRESYYLAAPEVIIYSLMQDINCFYKPKKSNEFVEVRHTLPITIIEGVGTAFLVKNPMALSIFLMCDQEIEIKRRIERARDGESNQDYEDVKKKSIERNEQFQINILPEKSKFDLELWSIEDYNFYIEKDNLNIF